jgi:cation transport ATPase
VAASAAGWLPIVVAAVLHLAGSVIVIFNSARLVRLGEELEPHVQDAG